MGTRSSVSCRCATSRTRCAWSRGSPTPLSTTSGGPTCASRVSTASGSRSGISITQASRSPSCGWHARWTRSWTRTIPTSRRASGRRRQWTLRGEPAMSTTILSDSPLADGLERLPVHPTTLAIFGATGDLANRKLLPALYNLAHDGALPERFNLVGISRSEMSDEEFREMATKAVKQFSRRPPDDAVLARLFENAKYVAGTFDQDQLYDGLEKALNAFDEDAHQRLNRCFYLSTAPAFFPVIVGKLGGQGLHELEGADVRVIIEKPFGTTLAEAQALNREVLSVFGEHQVFRIDHYLGKETVQNIMAFRFANGMFEPLWNRNFIDNVQITAAEDIGIGSRAGYYDSAGALRDLIQNHMLQLLCHVAMEPPVNFTADEVRNEKVKV